MSVRDIGTVLTASVLMGAFAAFVFAGIVRDYDRDATTDDVRQCLGLHDLRMFKLCVYRAVQ